MPTFNSSINLESFTTLQSNCPTLPFMPSKVAPSRSTQKTSTDPRPPKRSKMEKDISKIRKDIPRIFASLTSILSHQVYNKIELQILRDWIVNTLSVRYNVPPPVYHPFPPPQFVVPSPEASSSSDDSSPTP